MNAKIRMKNPLPTKRRKFSIFFADLHKRLRRSNTTTQQASYHEVNITTEERLSILDNMATALEQDRKTVYILSSDNQLLKKQLLSNE